MTRHYTAGKTQWDNGRRVPINYALGWGKPSSPPNGDLLASERAYGHGGATGTLLWIDPEWDLVYVFLTNKWEMKDPTDAKARGLNAAYGAFIRADHD
jgi:CubicO group peptidase (beta-lactamase class C family)